jgi:hypothetical protein
MPSRGRGGLPYAGRGRFANPYSRHYPRTSFGQSSIAVGGSRDAIEAQVAHERISVNPKRVHTITNLLFRAADELQEKEDGREKAIQERLRQKHVRRETAGRNEDARRRLLAKLTEARRAAYRARHEADRARREANRARADANEARRVGENLHERQAPADVDMDLTSAFNAVLSAAAEANATEGQTDGPMAVTPFTVDNPLSFTSPADAFNNLMMDIPFSFGEPRDFDILSDATGDLIFHDPTIDDVTASSSFIDTSPAEASSAGGNDAPNDATALDTIVPDVSTLALETNDEQPATEEATTTSDTN